VIVEPTSYENKTIRQEKRLKGTSLVKQIKRDSIVHKINDVFEDYRLVNRPLIKFKLS
jgi:hypothetical protein